MNSTTRLKLVDFETGAVEVDTTCVIARDNLEDDRRVMFPIPVHISPIKLYKICVCCRGMFSQMCRMCRMQK